MLTRILLSGFAAVAIAAVSVRLSTQDDPLAAADKAFDRKEYAAALTAYQAASKLPELEKERGRIAVRIGVTLARLQRFDEALEALDKFASSHPDARWFARALLERGVIAATMPHDVYEKDGKRTRGNWVQGAVYTWTTQDDYRQAVKDLERAAEVFEIVLSDKPAEPKQLGAELLRARLELASVIEAGSAFIPQEQPASGPATRPITWEDRMIAAFDGAIAAATKADDREGEALARYMKGAACTRLLMSRPKREVTDSREIRILPTIDPTLPMEKLPENRNPLAVLGEAAERAKGTKLEVETLMALASVEEQLELFVDAVKTYRRVVAEHPKSRYAEDARASIEQITFPRVALQATHQQLPGAAFQIEAATRNLKSLDVAITQVPLEAIYSSNRFLDDPQALFGSPEATWAAFEKAGLPGKPAGKLTHETDDDGRHRWVAGKLPIPALERGAYFVEARSGELVWRSLVLVSDLSLAAKFDQDQIVVFAVDAVTGKPVKGARVVVRQTVQDGRKPLVRSSEGDTDARGIHATGRLFEKHWTHVECFAHQDGRMALVDRSYWQVHGRDQQRAVGYVMSDRPVYRPGDPVRIAAVLRERVKEHEFRPLAGRRLQMVVRDPKGQQIFDQRLQTDDTGAFSQEIVAGKDAPLGVYHVQILRDGENVTTARFRIEEYLKPEFEVTVALPKEQVRLGSKVPVTVDAQYYFGGGVPGAEVTWRVFREAWFPYFSWRRHWMDYERRPSRHRGERELVASGQGSLSSEGRLEISFDTERYAAVEGHGSNFVVEADVMDSSRRTISGSASLLLAKKGLVLGVQPRRGFYTAGDFVECETQSKLPSGAVAAAKGTVRVFKVTRGAPKKDGTFDETRKPVHDEPHETDGKGVGFFRWQPDEGGEFAIVFEALDRFEQQVTGEARLWIYKPGEHTRDVAFANVELVPDRRTFKPGEVAKILVKSALPHGALLWSVDAGPKMLKVDVLELAGNVGVIEVPIERGHVPNVHVHVLAVSGGKFYEDRVELFVPPDDRFLDVKLAFAKETYRPGESGDLVVTTKTSTGEPVPARLAVTVLDASILAIQADESQDIRQFFYGSRRSVNVQRDSSAGLELRGYLARDVKWGRYDEVGGIPAWGGPHPGFVSRLFRGEGFGQLELESWGEGGLRRRDGGKKTFGRAAGGEATPPAGAPAALAERASVAKDDSRAERKRGLEQAEFTSDMESEDQGGGAPKTRTDFRDSALWTADVATDATGAATIKVPFPESLTTWRAKAWAWTKDTLVGQTTADVKTTKDVLVRLRAPRFFVEGDSITVAALVNNRTNAPQSAKVRLTLDGQHLQTRQPPEVTVEVGPNADRRVDWTVDVLKAGRTKIAAQVIAQADQDALETSFPVLEWGQEKVLARAAILENDATAELTFQVPAERRVESTSLELSFQTTLVRSLLEALPYLVEYPYGCTEQTTSRFIPAAIVAKVLGDAGVTLEDVAAASGPVTDLRNRDKKPVLRSADLSAATTAGIERLASMQNPDGSFGWWKSDRPSIHMTSYVLSGLLIGREADLPIPASMIERAAGYLSGVVAKEEQLEQATYAAYVLARAGKADAELMNRIFRNRDSLNFYGKALLASAMKAAGRHEEASLALKNLADFAQRDVENGTAHWDAKSRHWWWWWNGLVETNAAVLNAFVDVDPGHELARPLVKWLATHRRAGRWTNTRDTAHAVLALVRYAKASGELDASLELEVSLNGAPWTTIEQKAIDRRSAFLFDLRLLADSQRVVTGENKVAIRTRGKGRLYAGGAARFFTKEADIAGAGNELFVERSYARVISKPESRKVDGRELTELTDTFEPLSPGAEIKAGDVVEVRLKIDAKNDYDYLVFEDMKPAGFEPLEVKSGHRWGGGIASNVEFRDTRTAMFVTWMQQGTHTLSYRLRAEVPGTLRVLPARGHAMYAPDIAGTTSSFRFTVIDKTSR
jgi:uncharacterized protein YfaS (alpha-2-macroglobulin family)/tetratricopeptide (TPR) repeat protein